jgi:hypothetical protein
MTASMAFTVDAFEAFWANPDVSFVGPVLADDIVGHWAGRDEPTHGVDEYTRCIAEIIEALPGMRLAVAEHATNGDVIFIRWILHASGAHGPFQMTGIDRIRVRDGLVVENVIVFDTALFERLSGYRVPWAR